MQNTLADLIERDDIVGEMQRANAKLKSQNEQLDKEKYAIISSMFL
jgi:hypothetical protein